MAVVKVVWNKILYGVIRPLFDIIYGMEKPSLIAGIDTLLNLNDTKADINSFLNTYFDENIERSRMLDERYGHLWVNIKRQANAGGKRLRPYFVMLAYTAYKGTDYKKLIPVAAAHELLHISLLIHDDIIDKDYMRHGQTNLAGNMKNDYLNRGAHTNAEHFGNSAALLAGDLLLSGAYQMVLQSQLSDKDKISALNNIAEAIFLVGGGEFLDTESSVIPVTNEQVLKIADLKTARYSFVIPLITGAELAGASRAELVLLEEFGIALGIAFQLADDMLGVYGNPKLTGKSTLSDIREGKHTFLILQALQKASAADRKTLQKHLGNPLLTSAQAIEVQDILERSGAKAKCVQQIQLYAAQASRILGTLAMPVHAKKVFISMIERATERTS